MQGLSLFFLALQLFRTKVQVQLFLIALCVAFIIINSEDLLITAQSILDEINDRVQQTKEKLRESRATFEASNLRNILLPLLLAGTLLAPSRKVRLLFGLTLFTSVTWVVLAAIRQGVIGLIICPMLLLLMLPGNKRRELFFLVSIGMMIFVAILLVGLAYAWKRGALEWVVAQIPDQSEERAA